MTPTQRVEHVVAACPDCGTRLSGGWTRGRVPQVIKQEFDVSYDPSQVRRILKGGGWSLQKPALRSIQRDEDAIHDWRERRFAELKKGPSSPSEECPSGADLAKS